MSTPTFREINFHPWYNNVLDYAGERGLVTMDGRKVKITHGMGGFSIFVDDKLIHQGLDNSGASYTLNQMRTGVRD